VAEERGARWSCGAADAGLSTATSRLLVLAEQGASLEVRNPPVTHLACFRNPASALGHGIRPHSTALSRTFGAIRQPATPMAGVDFSHCHNVPQQPRGRVLPPSTRQLSGRQGSVPSSFHTSSPSPPYSHEYTRSDKLYLVCSNSLRHARPDTLHILYMQLPSTCGAAYHGPSG
jgi:hypothetical protein